MQKKLFLALILGILFACSVKGSDLATMNWVAVARVNNGLQLWQQIVSMPEIEPIYQGSAARIPDVLEQRNITFPAAEWFDDTFYLGIGFRDRYQQLTWVLWRGEETSPEFIGAWPSFSALVFSLQSQKATRKAYSIPLPKIIKQIDAGKLLHLAFNKELLQRRLSESLKTSLNSGMQRLKQRCDSNLKRLNRAIERQELKGLPEDIQLACPFKGNYSFDSIMGAAVCDHVMPQIEIDSATMNDLQLLAHRFVKMLDDISSFSLFCDQKKGQMVLRLEHSHEPVIGSTDEPEIADVLGWFKDLSQLAWVSNQFSTQLVVAPNFTVIAQLIAEQGMNLEGIKQFLPPSGPITLLARGGLSLISNQMPEIAFGLSYPDKMAVATIVGMLKQFGVEVEEDEIFGRQLWKLPVPDMRHAFNEPQTVERAVFIRAEEDGTVGLSLNRDLAQDLIAVAAGETNKIHLWNDVTAPVKFVYAQTMSGVARAILRLVNSALFEQEYRQCSQALRQWVGDNRDFVSKLPCDTALDENVLSLCSRKAIVVREDFQGQARLTCALHNYEAASLIDYQLLDVPIPGGRWLRFRLEKGHGYSQFVVDIKSVGGEK